MAAAAERDHLVRNARIGGAIGLAVGAGVAIADRAGLPAAVGLTVFVGAEGVGVGALATAGAEAASGVRRYIRERRSQSACGQTPSKASSQR